MKSISCASFAKGSYMKMTTLQTEKWFPTDAFGMLSSANQLCFGYLKK
jgi:hypothetical protein